MDESSEYRSLELTPEGTRPTKLARSHSVSWRVLAVFAVGSLLGVPFVAGGAMHATWAQLCHMFAYIPR
jgi:hypothetical protein